MLVEDEARTILRGEAKVMLREEKARPKPTRERAAAVPPPLPGEEGDMFDALRQWRTSEAKRQSVPPYVIFHDSVLREIAANRPTSDAALGEIRGVGASKLDRYGAAVLSIVASG